MALFLVRNNVKMFKQIYFLLLALIILGGFLTRVYKIQNPVADWHSWRQADTASVTRIYLDRGLDLLHPRYHDLSNLQTGYYNPEGWRFVEFPIFNLIHYTEVRFIPSISLEIGGRLISIVSSLISLLIVFLLGCRFLGIRGAILASFFFAFLPFNIYFSRVIIPEPLAVSLGLISIYFFVVWCDLSKRIFLLGSAIFFALALLVKPYVIFYGVPLAYLAAVKNEWKWRKMLQDKDLWLFSLISFLPLILWRWWMGRYPEGIPFYKWAFNQEGIRFKPSFWYWIFGERLGRLILGGWGLIPFSLGILSPSKSHGEKGFPLAFIFGMFLYVSVIAAANVRHDYYQTLIIPAVCLILARGVLFLWGTEALYQPAAKVLAIVVSIWAIGFSWFAVRDFYQINHPEIIEAGMAVDKIAPKDALVVAPYNGDTAFLYQTKRTGWPIQNEPVEDLVKKGADYYVSVDLNDPQTQDAMRKFEIPVQTDRYVIIDLNKKRMPKS